LAISESENMMLINAGIAGGSGTGPAEPPLESIEVVRAREQTA